MKHKLRAGDAHLLCLRIDLERLDAAYAGRPHTTRDHSRMTGFAAVAGQDSLRHRHALEIIGICLPADQDDPPARCHGLNSVIGREDDLPHRGSRTRVESAGQHLDIGRGVELRMKQLIELLGTHAPNSLLTRDEPLLDHINSDFDRSCRGSLAHTRLQHPQLTLLYGELDIAHITIMALEDAEYGLELLPRFFESGISLKLGNRLCVADARDNIFTLCVN